MKRHCVTCCCDQRVVTDPSYFRLPDVYPMSRIPEECNHPLRRHRDDGGVSCRTCYSDLSQEPEARRV